MNESIDGPTSEDAPGMEEEGKVSRGTGVTCGRRPRVGIWGIYHYSTYTGIS